MPIYEYRCSKCGKEFERMRPMSQAEEPGTCPACGNTEARRCLSRFASFSHSDGESHAVGGGGGCSSCSSSSCATCGKG